MKPKPTSGLRDRKGMAVILALATMLLVVTAALEMHISERNGMLTAAILRDRATAIQMAESGVHLAMAVLTKDRLESETDSLQEDWADEEAMAVLVDELGFDNGKLTVKITDETGKIQINALLNFPEGREFNQTQKALWERLAAGLFTLEGEEAPEDTDPLTIINSLKDWLDSGDDDATTGLSGAETDYYESLDPPYACKNGPFDHLSEVALVKGITPEVFAGIGGAAGLSMYVTVYGAEEAKDGKFTFPGKINVNTADVAVLSAMLPLEYADFAPLMVEHREATSGALYTNDITQPNWYKSVPGMADVEIDANLLSVVSTTFKITATAQIGTVTVVTTAVVQREKPSETAPWKCKVLNWKTE